MEYIDVLQQRSSVRRFKTEPVPVADLKEMVRCAGLAPSVNNSQPWKFLALTNQEKMDRIAQLVNRQIEGMFPQGAPKTVQTVQHFSTVFTHAPAMILVLLKPYQAVADKLTNPEVTHEQLNAQRKFPDVQSIGAAVENLLLRAVDLHYSACWLSGLTVAEEAILDYLGIDAPWRMAAAVAVGKPERPPTPKEKLPLEDIFELCD